MMRRPTYLRTVVTTACPLSCSYCHMEGDPQLPGRARQLERGLLERCLAVAVDAGVRKFKLLGGEPLVRPDLPEIVAGLRRRAPGADVSLITSGAAPVARACAVLAAGLDRMNVSIHGWSEAAFGRRGGRRDLWQARRELLDLLCKRGGPLKLNYVYSGAGDEPDLAELLDWAAAHKVLVGLLDDLGDPQAGAAQLVSLLERLRGPWESQHCDEDPDSLPATRLVWSDGLVVELKTSELGRVAPWPACPSCAVRSRCREGIFAVRLTHDGRLQLCMDRPDLSLPLAELVGRGHDEAVRAWQAFVTDPKPLIVPRRLRVVGAGGAR